MVSLIPALSILPTKRRVLFASLVAVAAFFVFLVELEHIHVVRYHAHRLNRPSRVELSLSLFKHHIPHELSDVGLLDERGGRAKHSLPPLDSVIDENMTIIGDPQPFLDFAIIGFGKCGTSTLMYWLADHPELQAIRHEVYDLVKSQPGRLVTRLHQLTQNLPRGYKSPTDINQEHVVDYYRRYFPKTKLFVGIRHPVLWFQSIYNFRVQNIESVHVLPHPNHLIGGCHRGRQRVCTIKGNFGYSLMRLGKQHWNGTREATELERNITKPGRGRSVGYDPSSVRYLPNDVFLFDVAQLGEKDEGRKKAFRSSIQDFLGLTVDLPDIAHVIPGIEWAPSIQNVRDSLKIDICDRQYIPVRRELMYHSRNTAEWIRTTFLDLPGVHVANRLHFEEIMESYLRDPCGSESDEVSENDVIAITRESVRRHKKHLRSLEGTALAKVA